MSAGITARSTLAAVGGDRVRALQHALYRAAKADPNRGFHALQDKVYREDVRWRAWVAVRANNGAPGIDHLVWNRHCPQAFSALEGNGRTPTVKNVGEPCAGEPHARFDGEGLETEPPATAPAPHPTPSKPESVDGRSAMIGV